MSNALQNREFDCLWLMAIIESIIELTIRSQHFEDEIIQSIYNSIISHATAIIQLFETHSSAIKIDLQVRNELELMTDLIRTNHGSPNENTRND